MKLQGVLLVPSVLHGSLVSAVLGGSPAIECNGDSTLHSFGIRSGVLRVNWFEASRLKAEVAAALRCIGSSPRDVKLCRVIEAHGVPIARGGRESMPVEWSKT